MQTPSEGAGRKWRYSRGRRLPTRPTAPAPRYGPGAVRTTPPTADVGVGLCRRTVCASSKELDRPLAHAEAGGGVAVAVGGHLKCGSGGVAPSSPTRDPPACRHTDGALSRRPERGLIHHSDQGYAPLPTARCCDDPLSPGYTSPSASARRPATPASPSRW